MLTNPKNKNIDEIPEIEASIDTPIYLDATNTSNDARHVHMEFNKISGFSIRMQIGDCPLSPIPKIHI